MRDLEFERDGFGNDLQKIDAFCGWLGEHNYATFSMIATAEGQHNYIHCSPYQLSHMLYYLSMKDNDVREVIVAVAETLVKKKLEQVARGKEN